jgi:hypothetical protein
MIIENGVGRDILVSGMARLFDATEGAEIFELTDEGFRYLMDSLDTRLLISAGVLMP